MKIINIGASCDTCANQNNKAKCRSCMRSNNRPGWTPKEGTQICYGMDWQGNTTRRVVREEVTA